MHRAIQPVFEAFKKGLDLQPELFGKIKFYFIGTSYAPAGKGIPTILPLAKQYAVEAHVVEITDRISYYHSLLTLQQADALFIPGSDDPQYTASKIYPYVLAQKPLIAIFNKQSSAAEVLDTCTGNAGILTFDKEGPNLADTLYPTLIQLAEGLLKPVTILKSFEQYSAENLTGKQVALFNETLKYFEATHTNA
jgi:hypothetical protein